MASAVVLLSAGLDSTYNLLKAREQFSSILALTFNYGQRSAKREVERASALANRLGVDHQVVDLPWFKSFTKTTLVNRAEAVPTGGAVAIDDLEKSRSTAKAVWVPNRNGIFLNIAAGFAEGLGAKYVVPGFNLEEAKTFPDNSEAFMKTLNDSFSFSTANQVQTLCYSAHMLKPQIMKELIRLDLPLKMLWPCYLDGEEWCRECESCQRFLRAARENGVSL